DVRVAKGLSEKEGGGFGDGFSQHVQSNWSNLWRGGDSAVECGVGEVESGASLSGAGTSKPGFRRESWAEDCEDGGLECLMQVPIPVVSKVTSSLL
ncbi:hypothetical protein Dimus_028738, partial [Dionaea muscipula]